MNGLMSATDKTKLDALQYNSSTGWGMGLAPNLGGSGWALTVGVPDAQATDSAAGIEIRGRRAGADGTFAVLDAFNQAASTGVGGRMGRIAFVRVGADNSGAITVNTVSAGVIGEVARFTAAGRMQVGSSTDGSGRLQVTLGGTPVATSTGATTIAALYSAGTGSLVVRDVTNSIESVFGVLSTGDGYFGTVTNHGLYFRTNAANRMRILNSGQVQVYGGSGTNSLFNLSPDSTTNAGTGLFMSSLGSSHADLWGGAERVSQNNTTLTARSIAASGVWFTGGDTRFFNNTGLTGGVAYAATETMRISTGGNVAIGTAADAATGTRLAVVRALASGSQVSITATNVDSGMFFTTGSAAQGIMSAGAAYNGTAWVAKSTTQSTIELNSGFIYFFGNTGLTATNTFAQSEYGRFNSSGQFLVGSGIAGSGRLQVTSSGTPVATALGSGLTVAAFYSAGSGYLIHRDVTNSIETFVGSNSGGYGIVGTQTNHPFTVFTNGVERLRVGTDFTTTFVSNSAAGPVVRGQNTANGTVDYMLSLYGVNAAGGLRAAIEFQLNGSQNDSMIRLYSRDATAGLLEALRLVPTAVNNETFMMVHRRTNTGTYSLERVTLGAADSGGVGFRALRVPN